MRIPFFHNRQGILDHPSYYNILKKAVTSGTSCFFGVTVGFVSLATFQFVQNTLFRLFENVIRIVWTPLLLYVLWSSKSAWKVLTVFKSTAVVNGNAIYLLCIERSGHCVGQRASFFQVVDFVASRMWERRVLLQALTRFIRGSLTSLCCVVPLWTFLPVTEYVLIITDCRFLVRELQWSQKRVANEVRIRKFYLVCLLQTECSNSSIICNS